MSEEGFFSRWSRRKRAVEAGLAAEEPAPAPEPPPQLRRPTFRPARKKWITGFRGR